MNYNINQYNLRICKNNCEFLDVHYFGDGDEDFSVGCGKRILFEFWRFGWKGCPYKFEQEMFSGMTEDEIKEYDKIKRST